MSGTAKPLAGRTHLTTADVLRMLQPSFWWTPQGSPLLYWRERAVVALMAFEGLALQLPICFEVRALSGSLVSSTPE
jgi:hypothetical protein